MKKIILYIFIIIAALIVLGVMWYAVFVPHGTTPDAVNGDGGAFPVGGSTTPTSSSTPSSTAHTMTITGQAGEVVINDFKQNGTTISDPSNSGNYLLAGNFGCVPDATTNCQAAPADDFSVYYNGEPNSFTITLTNEPLGRARADMEQFMLATLGISQAQMCTLQYRVGVRSEINEQYSGKNLGFSFCPGATVLPQ